MVIGSINVNIIILSISNKLILNIYASIHEKIYIGICIMLK